MKSRWIFLVFTLFSSNTAFSQSTDSLKVMAKEAVGEKKPRHYQRLAMRYYGRQQYDSARKYFELMAESARKTQQYKLEGEAFNNIGVTWDKQGDYKSAILSYQNALEPFKKTENDSLIAQSLANLGLAFKGMNIYEKALEHLFESAKTLEKLNIKRTLSTSYNAIGNIYRELGTMDLSYSYLLKALELRQEIPYEKGVGQSLHNIGIWYFTSEDYQMSKVFFDSALVIKRKMRDEKATASTLAKLGEIHMELKLPNQAEVFFQQSLDIRRKFENSAGIATSTNHLAEFYMKSGKIKDALPYLKEALSIAKKNGLPMEVSKSLRLYKDYYISINDFEEALEYSNRLAEVNDQILDAEKTQSLIKSGIRFEVYQKDLEIASQKIEVGSLKNRNRILLLMALGLLLIVIIIGLFLRASRRIAKERKLGKERVERLLTELNHRTKNHLQAQSGLIKQQMLKLKDEPTKDLIKDIDNQIKAINLIHQSLYISTEDSLESINLTSYVQNIVENLMISFGMTRNQIKLDLNLENLDIDVHKAMPIGLILNESVTNAFKHAFTKSHDKELTVNLSSGGDGEITLTVADNGKGFDINNVKIDRGGLRIMQSLVEELGGIIRFSKDNGGVVLVKF